MNMRSIAFRKSSTCDAITESFGSLRMHGVESSCAGMGGNTPFWASNGADLSGRMHLSVICKLKKR